MNRHGLDTTCHLRRRIGGDHQAAGPLPDQGARSPREDISRSNSAADRKNCSTRSSASIPDVEQDWKQYTIAMLVFSAVSAVFTYAILRLQQFLPWFHNIDVLSNKTAMTAHLAFNTAVSFLTNTNWQSYTGENTMTYFSQMVALASHNFWSAAVGIAVAAALVRGIARDKVKTLGNFWVDLGSHSPVSVDSDLHRLCAVSGFAGHYSELQALHDRDGDRSIRRGLRQRPRRRPSRRDRWPRRLRSKCWGPTAAAT